MRYETLYENFIDAVKKKIPHNAKVAAVLADILLIEKEAVYRRLRMDVPFTFAEIASISQKLGISLDNIVETNPHKSRPLQLKLVDYTDPSEVDFLMLENIPALLKPLRTMTGTELGMSVNMLPIQFYNGYENLARFYVYKWLYLSSGNTQMKPFSTFQLLDRLRKVQLDTYRELQNASVSNIILDFQIMDYLINDVRLLQSINLICEEDLKYLRQDLHALMDEMEEITVKGCFKYTGNKVNIYISSINFQNSYLYFDAGPNRLSLIKAFNINGIATMDEKTFEKMRTWINTLRRVSTLISESGEKERIMYFTRQRRLIDSI